MGQGGQGTIYFLMGAKPGKVKTKISMGGGTREKQVGIVPLPSRGATRTFARGGGKGGVPSPFRKFFKNKSAFLRV